MALINKPGIETIIPTGIFYRVSVVDEKTELPISGATVIFYNYNGVKINRFSTNRTGKASFIDRDGKYFNVKCKVSAAGYEPSDSVGVEGGVEKLVVLTPHITTYYYSIFVKDTDGNPIINASVNESSNKVTDITGDRSGKYTGTLSDHISSPQTSFKFSVEVDGYEYVSGYDTGQQYVTVYRSEFPTPEDIKTVVFQRTTNQYYYVISVVDSYGEPQSDIIVKTYTSLAYTTLKPISMPIISDIATYSVFDKVRDIIVYYCADHTIDDIKYDSKFEDFGISSDEFGNMIVDINDAFEVSITKNDINNSTVFELVTYIQQNSKIDWEPSIFKTDRNGLICIPLGEMSTPPVSIYVKGEPISGKTWSTGSSPLTPSNIPSVPGATLVISTSIATRNYYNVCLIDNYTKTYVYNINVSFYDTAGNSLYSARTDEYGRVSFLTTTYNGVCEIKVTDQNYQYEGYYDINSGPNDYNYIYLEPINSIRVLKEEDKITPLGGIKLRVYQIIDGQTLVIKEGLTNVSGYFETLNYEVYSSGKYKVAVLNYRVDSSDKDKLIQNIHTGKNEIYLPKESEDTNKFDKYDIYTINSIKKKIDDGNKVKYNSDDFKINIINPDSINVYDIFEVKPVIMENNQKTVVGSVDIDLKSDLNNLNLKTINRYSGYYNPIFKDILFYNDFKPDSDSVCPFSNTMFNPDYKDNYGEFGVINNLWFHKVNDNSNIQVVKDLNPYYPLIGQYALDSRDYNIFESNWDMKHFTRQIDTEHSESCFNVASMKEGLCMFGSKYLNVPETIEISGFSLALDKDTTWFGDWNDEWITRPDACPGEVMFKEVNDNSVDFYFFFRKRILRFFRDKLKSEFEKYIGGEYTFGLLGVEDDIDEYVTKNVLKLYKLENVKMFVRRIKKGVHNSKIENEYYKYLTDYLVDFESNPIEYVIDPDSHEKIPLNAAYFKSHGFEQVNTLSLSKVNRDDFDRKLVYNLRNGMKEDFGFSFVLKKI